MSQSHSGASSSDRAQYHIRAVLFREGDVWVGQCIEYDICAQAPSLGELSKRLINTVSFESHTTVKRGGLPFEGIGPAPDRFEEMWSKQSGTFTPTLDGENESKSALKRLGLDMAVYA